MRIRQMKICDLFIDEDNFLPKRHERFNDHHIDDLAERIKRGITLDPMTVWDNPVDGKTYIIAGHHRYKAYRKRRHKSPIKVRVFDGTLAEARLKASASNIKAVLPLNAAERSDTAWWLVTFWAKAGGYVYSKDQTAAASGVSKSQIAVMRRTHKLLLDSGMQLPVTWQDAVRAKSGLADIVEIDEDEQVNADADRLDAQIGSLITQAGHRSPRALARVLARRLKGRYEMVCRWADTEYIELEDGEEDEDYNDDDFIDGDDEPQF